MSIYLAAKDRRLQRSQIQVGILEPSPGTHKICQVTAELDTMVGLMLVTQLSFKGQFIV